MHKFISRSTAPVTAVAKPWALFLTVDLSFCIFIFDFYILSEIATLRSQ